VSSTDAFLYQADRAENVSPTELQKKTVEYVQSKHSKEEAPTMAEYPSDTIGGPLGFAQSGEKIVKRKVTEETIVTHPPSGSGL
jgi:hypothetical protein